MFFRSLFKCLFLPLLFMGAAIYTGHVAAQLPPATDFTAWQPGIVYIQLSADAPEALFQLPHPMAAGNASYQALTRELPPSFRNLLAPFAPKTLYSGAVLPDPALKRWLIFSFERHNAVENLLAELQAHPFVAYAEPKPLDRPIYTPNDFDTQISWHLLEINAENAWDVSQGDTNIVVAIVDDAVRTTHEDIAPNLWVNHDEIPDNQMDDDGDGMVDNINGFDVADGNPNPNPPSGSHGHGTFVAGCASAATDNGTGIASIGFNCRLMAIKASQDNNGQTIDAGYLGVQYAAASGADVINMSWGSSQNSSFGQQVIFSAQNSGAVLVAGAGNDNTDNEFFPAAYEGVIAVGSIDQGGGKSGFSNYGSWIDLVAPGVVYSTAAGNDESYNISGGTSFSSPIVAGLAALVKAYNPELTASDIVTCLTSSAFNVDAVNPQYTGEMGFGRVDAFEALVCAEPYRCDTNLIGYNFSDAAEALTLSEINGNESGYAGGPNSLGAQAVAEVFSDYEGYKLLLGVSLELAAYSNVSGTMEVELAIFESDNGLPTQIVHQQLVPSQALLSVLNSGSDSLYLPLDSTLEVGPEIAIAFFWTGTPTDTFALKAGSELSGNPPTALYNNGTSWLNYANVLTNDSIGLAIRPELTHPRADIGGDFTYTNQGNQTVQFFANGPQEGNFTWDFGDGNFGFGPNPVHTYADSGQYSVTLFINQPTCSGQRSDTVFVTSTQLPEFSLRQNNLAFRLYPNPLAGNQLYLHNSSRLPYPSSPLEVRLRDLNGRTLLEEQLPASHWPGSTSLDLTALSLSKGLYLVEIANGAHREQHRLLIGH